MWYDLYTRTLKVMGFEINTFDICVANKIIDEKNAHWYSTWMILIYHTKIKNSSLIYLKH